MKKTIIYIAVATLFAGMATESIYGQSVRRQQKQLNRMERQAEIDARRSQLEDDRARNEMHRRRVAEFREQGWRIDGARTLEVALLDHFNALKELDLGQEYAANVPAARSINLGKQTALANAQTFYATRVSAEVQGRIGAVMRHSGVPQEDIDKTMSQFATRVRADVGGVLTESFTLVRDNRGGGFDIQTIFIIDETRAATSRRRALEESIRETRLVGLELDEIFRAVEQPIQF